jgi:hypothetical protein
LGAELPVKIGRRREVRKSCDSVNDEETTHTRNQGSAGLRNFAGVDFLMKPPPSSEALIYPRLFDRIASNFIRFSQYVLNAP